jgi:hypothetical protein
MLKTLALAVTTTRAGCRLMNKFDWFILGATLTCAALIVCLYT